MFWTKEKGVEIRKVMARIINRTFENPAAETPNEHRKESRCKRLVPVLVMPLGDSDDQPKSICCFTGDISCEGISVISMVQVPVGPTLVIIGECDDRAVMRGDCRRTVHHGFGCFRSGIQLLEVLPAIDVGPVLQFAAALEASYEEEEVELAQA